MSNLQELKAQIIEDGKVDADEVAKLREVLLADGVIDAEEAKVLFEINDACSGNDNCPEWDEFFIAAISDHVLGDANSPGAIDVDEAKFIITNIVGDGKIDDLEKKLLKNLANKATSIDPVLQSKLDFLGIKKD